jgi:hypothetical protein
MSHDTGKRIQPRGSRAGVMYGLPKVHKEHTLLRLIISVVKTYNYELAKYLDEILKPLINDTFMLNDTYDFVNKIGDLRHRTDCYMVSFDVESLFYARNNRYSSESGVQGRCREVSQPNKK